MPQISIQTKNKLQYPNNMTYFTVHLNESIDTNNKCQLRRKLKHMFAQGKHVNSSKHVDDHVNICNNYIDIFL